MAQRQTVDVGWVREKANYLLANMDDGHKYWPGDLEPDTITPEQAYRLGAASVLESILHRTGNYAGFSYLGTGPGKDEYSVAIPDESRRQYWTNWTK